MKILTLFISLTLPFYLYGQAKEFNELIKQYGVNEFRWKERPPTALQDLKELVIPDVISSDILQVIKWKDIDSVGIFSFSSGHVRIVIYGRFVKYLKCNETENCKTQYFDTSYKPVSFNDSIYIPLKATGEQPAYNNRIKKRFRRTLQQLNNTIVSEHYSPRVYKGQVVFYNRKTREICLCNDCTSNKKKVGLYAKHLRNAKKLTLVGLVYKEHSLIIASFELYIGKDEKGFLMHNNGAIFNDEIVSLLKTIEPGTSFIFDQIRVQAPDGSIRTIHSPGFIVK